MSRTRFYYKKYYCEKCLKETGKLMTEEEYQTKKSPKCCGGHTVRREEARNETRSPFLGFAASRGVYDINDDGPDAGDRNVHWSWAKMEQAGKLDAAAYSENKDMIDKARRQSKELGWRPST